MTETYRSSKKHIPGVAISSIITVFHCPRRYYFYSGAESKPAERYSICKQISCMDPDANEEELWENICIIHPDISDENRSFLKECLKATRNVPIRPWTETDILVRSDRAGIHGLLDKYNATTGEYTLTRCTNAPRIGCWPDDALRAAAFLICLEETCTTKVDGIYIEYIPSGIVRYFKPTPKDRRMVLQLIHKVRDIDKGIFPEKPLNPPCFRCSFLERCQQNKPRRLSFLFKK
jgi:CRISPR/Cas system-associated exonuclease Cas4 (RecB family)